MRLRDKVLNLNMANSNAVELVPGFLVDQGVQLMGGHGRIALFPAGVLGHLVCRFFL